MNISAAQSSSSAAIYRQLQAQQTVSNKQAQNSVSAVDSDGDHDNGAQDGDKGRSIDIRA